MPPSEKHNHLESKLKQLPDQSGVYRFYDKNQKLIYVGKAKVLKNRVRSYFQKSQSHSPKVEAMVAQICDLDFIVTDNEVEALVLESNLIKQYTPRYNILARDDKKYPWIGISDEPFPRIFITRDPNAKKRRNKNQKRQARFFGPYISSRDMYLILEVLKKYFPMRQRKKPLFKNRPCINFDIGTCPGSCQNLITPEDYEQTVHQASLFLKGRSDELAEELLAQMEHASEALNFELAAKLRDRYQAVQNSIADQKVMFQDQSLSQDIFGCAYDQRHLMINVMTIAKGKLIRSHCHSLLVPPDLDVTQSQAIESLFSRFLIDFYQDKEVEEIPDSILSPLKLHDQELLEQWLSEYRKSLNKKAILVKILSPQKGANRSLLELSTQNAEQALAQAQQSDLMRHKNDPVQALIELQKALGLNEFPERMECYDISHFQGSQTVASMVVFTNGLPDKGEYRRFKIQSAEGKPDDFISMSEVIKRRFERKKAGDSKTQWIDPDLLIIDGGKGQLGAALKSLKQQGYPHQPIISLAKKFEEVYLPNRSRPILLPRDSQALFLLQQIRDEAHRFAITYHRKLRQKKATQSFLDDIPGIGEKTKEALLKQFGSAQKIKQCSKQDILQLTNVSDRAKQNLIAHLGLS